MDSNIVGAFIGAIATILAAFISRSYVEHRVRTTNSQRPLGRITEVLLGWLSVFSIGSAVGFSLREKESYVNDRLGIVVGVVHFYFYGALVTEVEPKANLNITVSGYERECQELCVTRKRLEYSRGGGGRLHHDETEETTITARVYANGGGSAG